MPVEYKKSVAVITGICPIEEAEGLLEWLLEHPKGKVNLKQLEHPHTALLQVLMAAHPAISSWPEDPAVQTWLRAALEPTA